VDVRPVKQATGRPYYSYFPTERATPPMPPAYADLLERMLRGVGELDASVTKSVAESLASRHRAEMGPTPGDDPEQRVVQVTQSLKQDGILESWHAADDGYHLVNNACPYIKAAEISKLPCESDRKAIELLIGLDVEQLNRIVDGAPCCEYLVHSGHAPEPQQLIELG
jgi:predicted ArsR family transcriptional regulator